MSSQAAEHCQYAWYLDPKSAEQYIGMADGYNGMELIRELRPHLKSTLPSSSTSTGGGPDHGRSILELGSGPGTDWELLCSSIPDVTQVVGSDISPFFVKRLQQLHPNDEFWQLDAVNIQPVPSTPLQRIAFDVIYSNKVLHHLTCEQLQASFRRLTEILKDGGLVCHSFWKGDGTEDIDGIMFSTYHSLGNVKGLMDPYFDIVTLKTYTEMDENDSILAIGRKKATK